MAVIEVTDLHRRYGERRAVDGVSFQVRAGEIVVLLGPNGAGKSTTLEILEGHRRRDSGTVRVLGHDPGDRRTGRRMREDMGVLLQGSQAEPHLTVREMTAQYAGYFTAPARVADVLDEVGIADLADRRTDRLSGGQRRRLDLALALVGNPRLLLCDEPTTGLDIEARTRAWDVLRSRAAAGAALLVTTHQFDEAEVLADRVMVMSGGQLAAEGAPADLRAQMSLSIDIRFRSDMAPPWATHTTADGFHHLSAGDDVVSRLHQLTGWALEHGLTLPDLEVVRPDLRAVYSDLTRTAEVPA